MPNIYLLTYLLTYLILSGPQVAHRSAAKLLLAILSSALRLTSSSRRFFSLISRLMVRLQVSFGLPALCLPSGLQLRACLGSRSSDILRTCPYHFQRAIFIFSTTLCWPVLRLNSSSLTCSYHLIFITFLKQLLSNLRTLSSISCNPFHESQPYVKTETTMALNSFNLVAKDNLSSFQTLLKQLNA